MLERLFNYVDENSDLLATVNTVYETYYSESEKDTIWVETYLQRPLILKMES